MATSPDPTSSEAVTPAATAPSAPDGTPAQKLAAEALGTAVLVLVGCGSLVLASSSSGFGDANILSVGLSFGLAVTVMAYAVGRVSGGHFNPAVSVAAAVSGRMTWAEAGRYAGAQVVGGIVGALVLLVLALGNDRFEAFDTSLAANSWGDDGTGYALWAALLVEIVLTALFVFVVLAVTDRRSSVNAAFAPLVIGLTLAVIHFVAIPLTGTSVNPARSIGPALFSGVDPLLQLWVFIVAPLLGAVAGGLAYPALFGRDADPVEGSGLSFSRPARAQQPVAQQGGQQGWSQGAQQGGWAQGGQQGQQGWAPDPAPIIQDGWQWDPVAGQWKPLEQPQAPQQTGQQTGQQGWGPTTGQTGQTGQAGQAGGQWPDEGDGRTQIRP